jgi:hypothetical protein
MASSVCWRLMFRVSDRTALDKCLARTIPLLDAGAALREAKPYWKVPELWECSLISPAHSGSAANQVLGCLLSAQSLGSGWRVAGSLSAECADGFGGVLAVGQGGASSNVAGLEWASFGLAAGDGIR